MTHSEKYREQLAKVRTLYTLAFDEKPDSPEFVAAFMAHCWKKHHPASQYEEPGKNFVCKDVAISTLEICLRHPGFKGDLDWWLTSDPLVRHTTPTIWFPEHGDWFSFEVDMVDGEYVGRFRKFKRRHSNPDFPQSVVLTADRNRFDLDWYRHIPGARRLTGWAGKVPDSVYRDWRAVCGVSKIIQAGEVLSGEAEELCDGDEDSDRKVPT